MTANPEIFMPLVLRRLAPGESRRPETAYEKTLAGEESSYEPETDTQKKWLGLRVALGVAIVVGCSALFGYLRIAQSPVYAAALEPIPAVTTTRQPRTQVSFGDLIQAHDARDERTANRLQIIPLRTPAAAPRMPVTEPLPAETAQTVDPFLAPPPDHINDFTIYYSPIKKKIYINDSQWQNVIRWSPLVKRIVDDSGIAPYFTRLGINPYAVALMHIFQESKGDQDAVSRDGFDCGLMGVRTTFPDRPSCDAILSDPETGIRAGVTIMKGNLMYIIGDPNHTSIAGLEQAENRFGPLNGRVKNGYGHLIINGALGIMGQPYDEGQPEG